MTLSMLYAAALVVPVVLLSLFYLRQMNSAVGRIVDEDIELMHLADRVSLDFLEARRSERNFLLYRDSAYLEENHRSLARIDELCIRGRAIEPGLAARFDSICTISATYRRLADSLAGMPTPEPGRARAPDLSTIRRHYESLIAAAASDSSARDSLLSAASRVAAGLRLELPGTRTLDDSIRVLQAAVVAQSDSIAAGARLRVQTHRQRARQLATWGQRNIVAVLLLVLIVLTWLLFRLPRRAVLPIKRLANALRRAEDGELDLKVSLATRDELGQLAAQLNRSFARLREFDEKKVDRILQLERRFRLLIGDISEGVLVVDRTPNIVLANAAMEPLLGGRPGDALGKPLRDYSRLASLRESLERVLAGDTSSQTCELLPDMAGTAVCIEALRDRGGTVTGALIVVTRPPNRTRPDGGAR